MPARESQGSNPWEWYWPAPAKLNLMLRVLGRREDGYHLLQTVFHFLRFGDELRFSPRNDGVIHRLEDIAGVPEADDLICRAARALFEEAGVDQGVDISIRKKLPMGGGLGGGSSNAATTLLVLNHLFGLNLELAQLCEIGLGLGADVPVFVRGHSCWAEGVGEQMDDLDVDPSWYLVVNPRIHISTADVFSHPELTRNSSKITIRAFLEGDRRNDCLAVVRHCYPEFSKIYDLLAIRAPTFLTGTGACLFQVYGTEAEAAEALSSLPEGCDAFLAEGANRSPLHEKLAKI